MPFLQTLGGGSAKGFRVKTVGQGIVAVGGIETSVGGYKIHTFNYTGSNQTFSVSDGGNVEMLVVAGGGGGGGDNSGGRWSYGGLLYYGAEAPNAGSFITVAPGTYNINVGAGGSGSPAVNTAASNGGDTTVSGPGVSITAIGGGGLGGTGNTAAEHNGGNGGSGGGAAGGIWWNRSGGNGTGGQGNNVAVVQWN